MQNPQILLLLWLYAESLEDCDEPHEALLVIALGYLKIGYYEQSSATFETCIQVVNFLFSWFFYSLSSYLLVLFTVETILESSTKSKYLIDFY